MIIMASAVPQQENDLPFFLHCGQRADGETAVCAESHQIRQIGRRQGGEKIAVDRSFSQSLQKGGLCGIGAVSGRAKHLPQQGLNGNKPILPCGKRDTGVAAVFAGDGRPHRSGQGVRQDHIIRGAAGGGGDPLPVIAHGSGAQLEKLGSGKEKQSGNGQKGDGDILNKIPVTHGRLLS